MSTLRTSVTLCGSGLTRSEVESNRVAGRFSSFLRVCIKVTIKVSGAITNVALADQIKSLDWRARSADFAASASPGTLRAVRRLVATRLEL